MAIEMHIMDCNLLAPEHFTTFFLAVLCFAKWQTIFIISEFLMVDYFFTEKFTMSQVNL